MAFTGDQKELDHYLLKYERWQLNYLLPRVPVWLETTHLTLMTLVWSAGVVFFGYMAAHHSMHWLWAFSFCILAQHITDMLDGAVGRARNSGLVKWGFYMDHFLDYIFMSAIIIGYSFLLPGRYEPLVLTCLALTGGFMVHSFLDFGITGKFKISVNRFGVSEMRYVLIVFNAVLAVAGSRLLVTIFPYLTAGFALALAALIYQAQKNYGQIDMEDVRVAKIRQKKQRKLHAVEHDEELQGIS